MGLHPRLISKIVKALDNAGFTTAKLAALGALSATESAILDGATVTTAELNKLASMGSTTAEIDNECDRSARVQQLTASGAVTAGVKFVELDHDATIIAATIADFSNHEGLFVVADVSTTGTAAHTLTLTAGTFNGTNNKATLNAPGEALCCYVGADGNGVVLSNVGSVALATV